MPITVPISQTKIITPHRRPELLTRGRLLRDISASLDRKLILISAPAGYGKTSLLVDLANSTDLPVCWLSLDPLDRDPQRFISYIVASLGARFAGLQAPMQPLLNNLRSIEQDAEEVIVTLTNELYNQVEEDFIFILDDFHLLDGLPQIASILNRFLQLVDDNCHMVLATRTLPELPDLTLMVAREQIEGLGQMELAFQPAEIQALFHQNLKQEISENTAQKLCEQSGGWITGILLSDETDQPRIPGADTFAYFGKQVLDRQPKALREFILRTCLPEEFNADLCEAVLRPFHSRRQNWTANISALVEKNLFILQVGGDGGWVRYHPLFREYLQSRMRAERPEEIQPILERLAKFHEDNLEWEKAYFTCQQLDDPERLAELVEHAGTPMLQHGFTTLEGWVNSLPPGLVTERPGLISLRGGMAIVRGNYREAVNLLNKAETAYRAKKNVEGLALVLTRRASAYRQLGKYESALEHAEEVLKLTESDRKLQAAYAEALRIKGLSLFRLGHSQEAIGYLEHSLSLFNGLKETGSIPVLLVETGIVHAAIGDMEAAGLAYQKALKIWGKENNLASQADVLNNIGNLEHQMGEYERAIEALDQGLVLARKGRYPRAEALILLSLGDIYSELEDYEAARQAYQKAQPIVDQWPGAFIDTYLILARANLALLQQDIGQARTILQKGHQRLQASSSLYERGLRALIEGRIHLLARQPDKAVASFEQSTQCFTQDGREIESSWGRIWLAAAFSETGRTKQAAAEILEVVSPGRNPGHAVLVMIGQAAPWLRTLRSDPLTGGKLHNILDRALRLQNKLPGLRRSIRRLAQSIEMPSASLVIRAFGRSEVQVNGRIVSSSEWSTQSVRDLFFYFLSRGVAVTKEQVAAALWPEVDDPQVLKQRFKAYIFRLRRATRRDIILFDEEYYRFNFGLDYEYDVEAFETFLARARATRELDEQIDNYQKAIELVKGPYLADVDLPWALGERERLEQIHLSALGDLAQLQFSGRRLNDALGTAQQILLIDPYREEVHRLMMRIHAARMDRAAIHHQYQTCKAALKTLGLAPSPETERLYHELTD